MNEVDRRIARVAAGQYGLIARRQALSLGASPSSIGRRLDADAFAAVLPRVYRLAGAPVTARQRALAATLWSQPHGVISHVTAGRLLRLDSIPRPLLVDVTIPRSSALRAHGVNVHRALHLPRIDRMVVDGIPCTSATRTIIDLAGMLDDEALEATFHSARRMGLTSPAHFARRFEALGGRGRVGSATLRALIERESGMNRALDSKLEVRAARLLRRSMLPAPIRQHPIGPYRVDFAWLDRWVAVECDGFAWHGNRLQWKRDRRRIAAIEAQGWRVVFVTWEDVTQRPGQTEHRIALALGELAA